MIGSRSLVRQARGDTIVEVLIVLTVLGSALGFAYSIANKSLQQSRDAEEHTEVVKILQGQLEELRVAVAGHGATYGGPFCYASDGSVTPVPHPDTPPFPASCTQGYYQYYITPNNVTDTFTATGVWDNGTGANNGQDTVTLAYRVRPS